MQHKANLHIGTSGVSVPIPRSAYPVAFRDKSRLTYYSNVLNSLEVNSTFYRNPRSATLQKWLEEVPDHFSFTFKLPKIISHAKQLMFDPADLQAFLSVISDAVVKQGCLLLQLPPSSSIDNFDGLETLLKATASRHQHWQVAVEFRNNSWYTDNVFSLLQQYAAAAVLHDFKKGAFFEDIEQPFYYFRFHGPESNYRGGYTDERLQEIASLTNTLLNTGKIVYTYFNNTMGDAYENAKRILELTSMYQ